MRNYGELSPGEKVERIRKVLRMLTESVYRGTDADKDLFERLVRGLSKPGDRAPELKKQGLSLPPTEEDLET